MSSAGERKCALLLLTLRPSDRRRLLMRLPSPSAKSIRTLVRELERMQVPADNLAGDLLGQDVLGLTADTSLDLDQLLALSVKLSPAWYARVLSVWTGIDRRFCVNLLAEPYAEQVQKELASAPLMPLRLVEALKAEALALAAADPEAA